MKGGILAYWKDIGGHRGNEKRMGKKRGCLSGAEKTYETEGHTDNSALASDI